MSLDYLGNPIDTDDHDARRALDDFIGGFIGYQPRAEAILASADRHPESALSNALAGILLMFVESPEGPALAEAYRRRAAAVEAPHPRAALYLQLLQAWISDDLDRVLSLADRLQAQYPRDLFAAKLNQYVEFNRGNWPALLRVGLKAVAAAPDIAQSHGMLAFAFEQCHLLEEAEASARQALALQADEPWAQHALAHVMLTQGRIEEGIAFLDSVKQQWEGLNSFMYTHNWWHKALFHISLGDNQAVFDAYDRHVWGQEKDYSQDQVGAVSLLARMEIAGMDVGNRWEDVADHMRSRARDTIQPFLTIQYLYGLARAERAEADTLMAAVEEKSLSSTAFDRLVWHDVVLPGCRGVLAHARGQYQEAVRYLSIANPRIAEIGGSHAQRDLFGQILLDAHLKAGNWDIARQLLEMRRTWDPDGVPLNRALAMVYQKLGKPEEAAQAAARHYD